MSITVDPGFVYILGTPMSYTQRLHTIATQRLEAATSFYLLIFQPHACIPLHAPRSRRAMLSKLLARRTDAKTVAQRLECRAKVRLALLRHPSSCFRHNRNVTHD